MEKLKSCPFCGIIPTRFTTDGLYYVKCNNPDCWICPQTAYYSESKTADTAWNDRPAPENKPLTLDELRKMDGEPVWTVSIGLDNSGRWEILESASAEFISLCNTSDGCYGCEIDTYGKTWLAYARKPEQEEK